MTMSSGVDVQLGCPVHGGRGVGEQDLQPFIAAMAAEGRFGDEMYLTQFVFEEAKHTQAFRLWFDAVGLTDDLHEHVEENPAYMEIFTQHLPESLYALAEDPSPRNQIRASYLQPHRRGHPGSDGYFAWSKVCASRGILPGMQQVIKHIGDDERRHMAWGTFTCAGTSLPTTPCGRPSTSACRNCCPGHGRRRRWPGRRGAPVRLDINVMGRVRDGQGRAAARCESSRRAGRTVRHRPRRQPGAPRGEVPREDQAELASVA